MEIHVYNIDVTYISVGSGQKQIKAANVGEKGEREIESFRSGSHNLATLSLSPAFTSVWWSA